MLESTTVDISTENQPVAQTGEILVKGQNASESSRNEQDEITSEESETTETESEKLEIAENGKKESEKFDVPKGVKKKIDKLTAKNYQLLREIEELRRPASRPQAEHKEDTSSEKPDPGKFDTNAEYIDALTDWKLEQREKAQESKRKQDEVKSAYQKQVDAHTQRINEFKKSQPDYDDVVAEFLDEHEGWRPSPALDELIQSSDLSAKIVYDLAKSGELARVNTLPFLAAAREIAKIELRLSTQTESQTQKTTTKAPAPINPVGAKSAGMIAKSSSEPGISFAEYERRRRTELQAKRK